MNTLYTCGTPSSANLACFSLWFPLLQPKCDRQRLMCRKKKKGHVSLQNILPAQERKKRGNM